MGVKVKRLFLIMVLLALSANCMDAALNFSVIGNFQARTGADEGTHAGIKEMELALQSPLTENIQANIFLSVHGQDDGSFEFHAEEAYFNLVNLPKTLTGFENNWEIGGKIGQKNIGFGKLNPLHPEQWRMLSAPLAFERLFGEEAVRGTGGQLEWAIPLPFFLQVELGLWNIEREEENTSDLVLKNKTASGRLWTSFSSSDENELELGLSTLQPLSKENAAANGADLTYRWYISSSKRYVFQSEYILGNPGDSTQTLSGGYVLNSMKWNTIWETGMRYDWVDSVSGEGNQWALILTRHGSETSKTRVECLMNKDSSPTFIIQYIFGVGPHAHTIQ